MAMRSPDELKATAQTRLDDIQRDPPRPRRARQGPGLVTRPLRRILAALPRPRQRPDPAPV